LGHNRFQHLFNGKVAQEDDVDVSSRAEHVPSGFDVVFGTGNPIDSCLLEHWHRLYYTAIQIALQHHDPTMQSTKTESLRRDHAPGASVFYFSGDVVLFSSHISRSICANVFSPSRKCRTVGSQSLGIPRGGFAKGVCQKKARPSD
jgi:hypothetical protein